MPFLLVLRRPPVAAPAGFLDPVRVDVRRTEIEARVRARPGR